MRKIIKDKLGQVLWWLVAPLVRNKKVIAITGSAGKSTTKLLIGSVLRVSLGKKVLIGYGNLGTTLGIPLALLKIKNKDLPSYAWLYLLPLSLIKGAVYRFFGYPYKVIVLEVSADLPGQIDEIGKRLHPSIVVITSIGASHLEFFSSISGVEKEKGALISHLKKNGLLILPASQKKMNRFLSFPAKVITLKEIGEEFDKQVAILIGKQFFLNSSEINEGLASADSLPGRLDKITSQRGFIIIDSSYNANPVSMEIALNALAQAQPENKKAKKIAVLGTMAELGKASSILHQEVGKRARKVAQIVISVGEEAKAYQADFHFKNYQGVGEKILAIARKGDIILIKGSHAVHLDKIVARIK